MHCLEMATAASRKAEAAPSPGEAQFWLRMEKRWLRLAQTYRDTEQLAAAWLRTDSSDTRAPSPRRARIIDELG